MHQECADFVVNTVNRLGLVSRSWSLRVLECGSMNINGSVRSLFSNANPYVGIDLVPGDGVDVVSKFHEYETERESWNVMLSLESLEHDKHYVDTLEAMHLALKPGGVMILTCALQGREEHGTENARPEDSPGSIKCWPDFYNAMHEDDLLRHMHPEIFDSWGCEVDRPRFDFRFWGIKR